MAITRALMRHETVLGPTTSTLRLTIEVHDDVEDTRTLRHMDVPVAPGSALETAMLNFDTALINRINTVFPARPVTRPLA